MKALIQNENGLLINGDSYTTPDTIRIDNIAYSFMNGSNGDIIIGDTNSGYMTALNEDGDTGQSVDLPIIYQLGAEVFTDATVNFGWTDNGDGTYTMSVGGTGNLSSTPTVSSGTLYRIVITTVGTYANNGLIVRVGSTNNDENILSDGAHEYDIEATGNGTITFRVNNANDFSGTVSNISVKEVTNTSSYNTYYDVDTKAFKTIDNPVGTTYNMTDSFSSYFTTDVPVTEGDRAKLNANNNLIYDLWFGDTLTGLSFTKANVINFVPATEGTAGGDTVTDISNATGYVIQNYTANCRTFYVDEVYGFQNVLADQDGTGVITGMADLTTVDMIEPLRVRSPDGTVWIITVDDLGVVSAVEEV